MTARKRKTPPDGTPEAPAETARQPVKAYDPRRITGQDLLQYAPVTVTRPDGTQVTVNTPLQDGQTPEEVRRAAIEYAQLLQRVSDAWNPAGFSADYIEGHAQNLAAGAASLFAANVLGIAAEQYGDAAAQVLNDVAAAQGLEDALQAATDKQAAEIYQYVLKDRPEIVLSLEKDLVAGTLEDFEKAHGDAIKSMSSAEYDRLFSEAYASHRQEHGAERYARAAETLAQGYLEALDPTGWPLDQLIKLLLAPDADTAPAPDLGTFVHGTGKWSRAIQEGIIKRTDQQPLELVIGHRRGSKSDQHHVRIDAHVEPGRFGKYPGLQADSGRQAELLIDMQQTLASWKENSVSAALLKVHLDLTSMAYEAAQDSNEERPAFMYRLGDALERQGYTRNSKRRGYDPGTMQGLRQRLEALYSHSVTAWAVTKDRKQIVARSPYWIMEEEYEVRQLPLDLDVVPALAANAGTADIYNAVLIRPGRWWEYAEMSERRYPMPASILQLPTDGRGREKERYALFIATFLGLHIRRNQRNSAGKSVPIKAGTLLEESGIVTWEEFDQMRTTPAVRIRNHLHHDSEEAGVFPMLRDLGAFDVQILDVEAFHATGRGWRETFWEARLEIHVPDLGIVKAGKRDG